MLKLITPGKEIDQDDEGYTPDSIALDLLDELKERIEPLEDFRAYLENAPLGNAGDVGEHQQFPGIMELREMSKNNYAKLIVSATTDRLGILGFRTGAANDEYGDKQATEAFERDDMGTGAPEAMSLACGYRTAYLYVDPLTKRQRVVPPTNGAVARDVSGETASAIVLFRDRLLNRDVMHLYMRDIDEATGEAVGSPFLYVAVRDIPSERALRRKGRFDTLKVTRNDSEVPLDRRIATGWVWWKSQRLSISRVPVTTLKNKDGENEFESHTDVIDRLNHMIFQRVIIATMQSFRQRAVRGDFPLKGEDGKEIDYDEMFGLGPGSLWLLPKDSEMWESTPPQFQDILSSVKDDTRDLASSTYTPMSYFSDSANNSAEGAALQRENYISKVSDRRRRFGARWKRHISILFEVLGDTERSDEERIEVIWQPLQVESLAQRVQAFTALAGNGLAVKTAMREALGFTPQEIKRAVDEATHELFVKQAQAISEDTALKRRSFGSGGDNGGGNNNGGGASGGLAAAANKEA